MTWERLGLFGRVFLLFAAVCVLPALAVLWYSSAQIDERIRDHNRRSNQVKSLVNSAQAKARTAGALVFQIPDEFFRELSAESGRAAPAERVANVLDRFVCATRLEGLNAEQQEMLSDLLQLMDPQPPGPRGKPGDRIVEKCFPPLRAYRPDPAAPGTATAGYENKLLWLAEHSWRYEEIADIFGYVGRNLPICNYVLLLDGQRNVVGYNGSTRYGRKMPADWNGRPLAALPASPAARKRLADMADQLDKMLPTAEGPPDTDGAMVVADRIEGLDLLNQYTEEGDYRKWSMAVMSTVKPGAPVPPTVKYVLFVVNWSVIQAEVVTDQVYKRSRNLDRLRLLVFEPDPDGVPRVIASGVPAFLNQRVEPGSPTFGPDLARAINDRVGRAGNHDRHGGTGVAPAPDHAPHFFEARPGTVAPPADLKPAESGDADTEPPPELLIGAVRTPDPPTVPPGWRAASDRGPGIGFNWTVAIYYDLDEGSVAPAVRNQVYITALLLTAVMLAACWVVGRMVSRPVAALRQMVGELAAGNYRPADEPAAAAELFRNAPREIQDLHFAFRDMAAQVVTKHSLEEKNEELSEKNRRLDEAVAELTRARNELQAGKKELENKARTLEETIARLNSTQQELLVSNMLASLGVISGEYAHAVNNGLQLPLATLQQLEASLGSLHLPEPLPEDILSSVESLKNTAAFVTQFRDFARNDSYAMFPLELDKVVESVASGWRPQLKRRQIDLETQLGAPPPIKGNDSLLMHVLLNLLLNARDAIRERRQKNQGGPRIAGKIVLKTYADDHSAMLSITDNGCGIPPEIAPKLFQAMFTTKPKGEGSGLGLSSVLRAVRQHKGEIWFESKPGQGTTFFIRIPALENGRKEQ